MGQVIEVEATRLGTVAIFDTDRSLSGQDGESFGSAAEAREGTTYPARLAERLFAEDQALTNVYVYSNTVSLSRSIEWDEAAAGTTAALIRNFLIHYDENRPDSA